MNKMDKLLLANPKEHSQMTRKYPQQDVKVLYGKAAGRCSFPNCRINLILEGLPNQNKGQIGKIGHIVAHSEKGPRADKNYPSEKLDRYENWVLLCGTHHDTVDVDNSSYSVDDLLKIKNDHEDWVKTSLETEVIAVGFAELEVAASALIALPSTTTGNSFNVTAPLAKMEKNNLSEQTYNLLIMGLSRSQEAHKYIEEQSKLDPLYPERLKNGFKKEYIRLVNESIIGDDLFESMLLFASGNTNDFKRRAAGLTILSHLFEICEIFEP